MKKLAIGVLLHALMLATGVAHATSSSPADFESADFFTAGQGSFADATGFKHDSHGGSFSGMHDQSPMGGWWGSYEFGCVPYWPGHGQIMSVPEPSTAMLQVLGLAALGLGVRQARRGTKRV